MNRNLNGQYPNLLSALNSSQVITLASDPVLIRVAGDRIVGDNQNNTLTGKQENDKILGKAGNDTLDGQGGADTLVGGKGNDTLLGNTGNDTMRGSGGNDVMIWNPGEGSDLMQGGGGNDTAISNGDVNAERYEIQQVGNRVAFARISPSPFELDIRSTEQITLNAGGGSDNLTISDLSTTTIEQITFNGDDGNDRLLSSPNANISIIANGGVGNDFLRSGLNEDVLNGGEGNDQLLGTAGDDIMRGDSGDDVMTWNPGDGSDLMDGGSGKDTALTNGSDADEAYVIRQEDNRALLIRQAPSVFELDIRSTEKVVLNAGEGNDALQVNDLSATDVKEVIFNGQAGNDQLSVIDVDIRIIADGGEGDDFLRGGLGNDILEGGDGQNNIQGNAGNDQIFGGADNDFQVVLERGALRIEAGLFGGTGNDNIFGLAGSDSLVGDAGNDFLNGGNGQDRLFGAGIGDLGAGSVSQSNSTGVGDLDRATGGAGLDQFFLGDGQTAFYDDLDDTTNGREDAMIITDFNLEDDEILLTGSLTDYVIGPSPIAGQAVGDSIFLDTDKNGQFDTTDELIAVIQNGQNIDLSNDDAFVFLGGDPFSTQQIRTSDLGINRVGQRDLLLDRGDRAIQVGHDGQDIFNLTFNQGKHLIRQFEDGVDFIALKSGTEFEDLTLTQKGGRALIHLGDRHLATLRGVDATTFSAKDFLSGDDVYTIAANTSGLG